jgi:oxygen-dependent protoporphyrinogen oxidase
MTADDRVVVVGGGICGLAAAWELSADPTLEVVVVESSERFGGKIRTSAFAGRAVDEGADAFLLRVPEGLALADELGLGGTLVSPATSTALVWCPDGLRPLPSGLVLGIPTDAEALAGAGIVSPAAVEAVRVEASVAGDPLGGDESVGSLVRRRFGVEVLRRLVEPLVGGINAGEADELSVDAVVPQIAAAARRDASLTAGLRAAAAEHPPAPGPVFAAPRAGMGALVDELAMGLAARGVDLRTGAPVASIERRGRGWSVAIAGDDPVVLEAGGVVVAAPAAAASRLLAPVASTAAALLGGIAHASVAMVTLAVPTALVRRQVDASGFLVPRDAGLTITAASWASSKWAHLAGGDTAILRVSCGHHADPRPVELPDDELLDAVLADLATTMGLEVAPSEVRISRYVDGFPQYEVGHLDRVAAIESAVRDAAPRLVVAGAALRGLGVPACIRQGRQAAHQLAGSPR